MKRANSKRRAFTIVELIIVIAVIGVLAAILIPAFSNMIAKANAKAALSDARNSLTAFLADNLEVIDGQIAASIVIFVKKAGMHYIYGYQSSGPDMGKLMQSAGNPFKYDNLAELIEQYNCTDYSVIGAEEENAFAFYLWPHDQPSGSGSGVKGGTKDGGMDEINNNYINLTDRVEGLPDTTEVFDGFLIGMIVDANQANPGGGGTNPGDNPGGGGNPGGGDPGGDPGTTEYTVTYDKGTVATAENMPENTTTVNGTHTVTTLIPTSEGYTFDGWEYDGGTYTGEAVIQNITSDITLTATWVSLFPYELSFVEDASYTLNLKEGFTNPTMFEAGIDVSEIIADSTATKAGEEFTGWKEENSNTIYNIGSVPSPLSINADFSLTPVWKQKYTLTFDLDGGDNGPSNMTFYAGDPITLPATVPTKADKAFGGWLYNSTTYAAGGTIPNAPDNDIELTAIWTDKAEFEVVFEKGTRPNATNFPSNATVDCTNSGEYTVPSTPPTSDSQQFLFTGWATTLGTTVQPGDKIPYDSSFANTTLVLTAQWVQAFTVQYRMSLVTAERYQLPNRVPRDTTFEVATFEWVASQAPASANFVVPEGKEFKEWVLGSNSSATSPGTPYQPGDDYLITTAVYLYATFESTVKYTVTYNANGGSGTMTDSTQYAPGATVNILANTFTRSAHEFTGWNTAANGSGTAYPETGGSIVNITGNVTLYAQWQPAGGLVYLPGIAPDDEGRKDMPENSTEQGTITISSLIPKYIPSTATLDNTQAYSFNYWTDSSNNKFYPGDTITVSGLVELTAQWTMGCRTISSIADFEAVAKSGSSYNMNTKYVMKNDLDLLDKQYSSSSGQIGYNQMFTGVFNGNGYTISRYKYNNPGTHCLGLFDWITTGAEIKYLNMTNCSMIYNSMTTGSRYGGVLASFIDGGTFTHIVINNSTVNMGTAWSNIYQGVLTGAIDVDDNGNFIGEFINVRVKNSTYNSSSDSGRSGPFAGRVAAGTFTNCWIDNCKGTTEPSYTTLQLATDYRYTTVR